jgi:predicted dinucleotide-binding enzyme
MGRTPRQRIRTIRQPRRKALRGNRASIIHHAGPGRPVTAAGPNLSHGLDNARSGSAMVQALAPDAKVVKAFTIYGFENFENPAYPAYDVKPVMMYCGEGVAAKAVVGGLIRQLGWEPLDVGGLDQALHLEHLTLLWVRMVRVNGHSPNMVWAVLRR